LQPKRLLPDMHDPDVSEDVSLALHAVHALRAADDLLAPSRSARRTAHLMTWATRGASVAQTEASLTALRQIKQSAVSITLGTLTTQGYVVALPRQGNAAIEYVLSGTSRLIFG